MSETQKTIYLDNGATSFPKPPAVEAAMSHFMLKIGGSPGRSGHRLSQEAARVVFECREALAGLIGAPDSKRVVFTLNATQALNTALYGTLRRGDRVVTTSMEHNSVMRPLRDLERRGVIELHVLPCERTGSLDPRLLEETVRTHRPRLVAAVHASNVTGSVIPLRDVGGICRAAGALLLVDAAQSAGALPIDVEADRVDLLAFTGHKSLYGPMGTGGLVIGERVDATRLEPLKRGGTGSRSEHEEQPEFLPDLCESGTPNAVGLAGLGASVRWVLTERVEKIRAHELALTGQLLAGLAAIPGVTVYGTRDPARQTATVSFNIAGLEPSEVGLRLDDEYEIACRVGLHCAPAAHRTLGTFPGGSVRFGLSAFNTAEQVAAALDAVAALAREAR